MKKRFYALTMSLIMILGNGMNVYADENSKTVEKTVTLESEWDSLSDGEYPVDVLSEEYENYALNDLLDMCNMPTDKLEELSTHELAEYVTNYPYLIDVLAFDELADGINYLKNNSNIINEFLAREDVVDTLIDTYADMDVDYDKVIKNSDIIDTDYDMELFIEGYIGINVDKLNAEQYSEFVQQYNENYNEKENFVKEVFIDTFWDAVEQENNVEQIESLSEYGIAPYGNVYLTGTCNVCGQKYEDRAINIKGKNVGTHKWLSGGYTSSQISSLDNSFAKAHPSFKKVRGASGKYNCHSYAWYSTSASNIYWIDNPASIYNNTSYYKLTTSTPKSGNKITFWNSSALQHSANAIGTNKCTSKMGHYGVYTTSINDMKTMYGSTIKTYVAK